MKTMNKILTLMILATSALHAEQISEKQITTEYVLPAGEFNKKF